MHHGACSCLGSPCAGVGRHAPCVLADCFARSLLSKVPGWQMSVQHGLYTFCLAHTLSRMLLLFVDHVWCDTA